MTVFARNGAVADRIHLVTIRAHSDDVIERVDLLMTGLLVVARGHVLESVREADFRGGELTVLVRGLPTFGRCPGKVDIEIEELTADGAARQNG